MTPANKKTEVTCIMAAGGQPLVIFRHKTSLIICGGLANVSLDHIHVKPAKAMLLFAASGADGRKDTINLQPAQLEMSGGGGLVLLGGDASRARSRR
mmetsp:Transcript_38337/g.96037  ORF Transcript_38337/g.96037 Transcript_38337/m.96037 type:complete len:97 (+) Transcript_38337:101-391(+)